MYEMRLYDWKQAAYVIQGFKLRREHEALFVALCELFILCSANPVTVFVEDLDDPKGKERIQVYGVPPRLG